MLTLSPRQTEVLQLRAAGLPRRDVAARLGISVKTYDMHIIEACHRNDLSNAELVQQFRLRETR